MNAVVLGVTYSGYRETVLVLACTMMITMPYSCVRWVGVGWQRGWGCGLKALFRLRFQDALDGTLLTSSSH